MRTLLLCGGEILPHATDLREVYADAFGDAPWHEDDTYANAFLSRLEGHADRPGFHAALAFDGQRLLGFCTAWLTPAPFPGDRCYPQVAAALGPELTGSWLCGSQEVDELAVRAEARGRGLGTALLDAVTSRAPDDSSWLMTSVRAPDAVRFYRQLGWRQIVHPAPEGRGMAVFLAPRHPAIPSD
ncbi:GNAT family N-acetyltransferase [Streptomyces sp. ICBB 8177]|uniref:GNAT family N-acetyltransferase n=1 Tax=Streptomyces sp. ICBB 8177 TaxID=563922 RepID=UPI000D680FD6|nr:GNAT family N-acetyltransferase [Streptomyces sp. ICBB 8177]PWI44718.1 GNAT family N-acetyltransferase [Streptomyces sp. ICBB 8177]